jgi:hypothetical protein
MRCVQPGQTHHAQHQLANGGAKLAAHCQVLAQCELHDPRAVAESQEISLDFLET